MVIWVTGLSGSGKTTLCNAVWYLIKPAISELVLLDGDVVRKAFGDGLGYREEDRVKQITRLQRIARMLSEQEFVVMVSALYAHPTLLKWNRQNFLEYFEVYLEASLDTVKRRDTKGLYNGVTENVVGVDIPWHVPKFPNMIINMDEPDRPQVLARRLIAAVPRLARAPEVR